jgi:hypothetical protein
MQGLHPFKGKMRCPDCKKATNFCNKNQGVYAYAIVCSVCRKTISPVNSTIFRQTNIFLSVWLKGIYIVREVNDNTKVKDLQAALGVAAGTARNIKAKAERLKPKSIEMRLMESMRAVIKDNFYIIYAEKPNHKPIFSDANS